MFFLIREGHLRFVLCYTVIIPAAPEETVGKPGSNPGLLRGSLVIASGLNHWATTSHYATTSHCCLFKLNSQVHSGGSRVIWQRMCHPRLCRRVRTCHQLPRLDQRQHCGMPIFCLPRWIRGGGPAVDKPLDTLDQCPLGEVDFWVTISYSLQLIGKIILRLKYF
jgi:hypothetical protein